MESILASNMNRIHGIIWGQCTPGLKLVLKGNKDYPTKSNFFYYLWLMKEAKNITAGLDVKINDSTILYHCIRGFINMRQVETDINVTFKMRFNNIYENM